MSPQVMIWLIAAIATAAVILRPLNLPEAVWAVAGALLLIALRLISIPDAATGVAKGTDVYLFLFGMMLLAEVARKEGLFDWLAAIATTHAKGSAGRLFLLTYGVGTIVTVFLSNDATAVVLTPAVAAAVRTAKAEQPLPYLLICAFIANAASFVLPISNPANLVIYGRHMPPLLQWLPAYFLPSVLSVAATYVALRWTQSLALGQRIATDIPQPKLSRSGKTAAVGLAATAVVLLASSTLDFPLGLPTAIAGTVTAAIMLVCERTGPWIIIKNISWGVLPLVAGLFVLVEGLNKTGIIGGISMFLREQTQHSTLWTAAGGGVVVAFASNLANNLPARLIAASALQTTQLSDQITRCILIGVDVGPNLSVTGSLATILWLTALRREGHSVSFGTFLKLGVVVMPPALLVAIAAALLSG
jgi:arsenical pump membrane protein